MNPSDFPTERDQVYGWESVHEPDHRSYKTRERMLYADLSKLYYDRASILADLPGQQEAVDKYNTLGHKYYLLSIGQEEV
jgi:hypothetical protein